LGTSAGFHVTGSGNVCIGWGVQGEAGVSNTTWIRNVYASTATARPVYVNSDNKIGTLSSSRRYKEEIKPMDRSSEALFALKPVSFRYKRELDPSRALSFGLIAEEVAEISPELITRDEEGKPQTVRYEAVNAMLLNEFLKEHKRVQELNATVAKQEATVARQRIDFEAAAAQQQKDFRAVATEHERQIQALTATVNEQASQIEKVSAGLGTSEPRSQMVLNNR
jgi:hypothetical protein